MTTTCRYTGIPSLARLKVEAFEGPAPAGAVDALVAAVEEAAERLRCLGDWLDPALGLDVLITDRVDESTQSRLLAYFNSISETSSAMLHDLAVAWADQPHDGLADDDVEALVEEALGLCPAPAGAVSGHGQTDALAGRSGEVPYR